MADKETQIMVPLFSPDRKMIEDFAPVNLSNPNKEITKIFLPGVSVLPQGMKPIPPNPDSGLAYFQSAKYILVTIGPDNCVNIGNIPGEKIGNDPIIVYVREQK